MMRKHINITLSKKQKEMYEEVEKDYELITKKKANCPNVIDFLLRNYLKEKERHMEKKLLENINKKINHLSVEQSITNEMVSEFLNGKEMSGVYIGTDSRVYQSAKEKVQKQIQNASEEKSWRHHEL